jgi:hypothetical protein
MCDDSSLRGGSSIVMNAGELKHRIPERAFPGHVQFLVRWAMHRDALSAE